jgi:hypothetical protein
MDIDARTLAMYPVIFGPLGIVFGLVGFISIRWAEAVYISAAAGEIVQTLGPVFAGTVVLQNTIMIHFLSLALVLVFSFQFGTQQLTTTDGAAVGGLGGIIGHASLLVPSIPLLIVAPAESQVFTLPSMLPLAISALVMAGLIGAISGYFGAKPS